MKNEQNKKLFSLNDQDQKIFSEKLHGLLNWLKTNRQSNMEQYLGMAQILDIVSNLEAKEQAQKTQYWIKWATITMALTSIANLIITLCR